MSYLDFVSSNITVEVSYQDATGFNLIFSNPVTKIIYAESELSQELFITSLIAPPVVQASPMDTWNNTKIPLLDESGGLVDGWYPVHSTNVSHFSSLLGIPLQIPFVNNSLYEAIDSQLQVVMQSAYLTVTDCTPQVVMSKSEINQTIFNLGTSMSESPSGTLLMSFALSGESYPGLSYSIETLLPGILTFSSVTDTNLMIGGGDSVPQFSYTACKLTQTFVDSQVVCYGSQCKVVGMRPSLNATQLSPMSALGHKGSGPVFMDSFVNLTSPSAAGFTSLIEQYINEPKFLSLGAQVSKDFNLTTLALSDLQQRLALLLNTYWQAGFNASAQTTVSAIADSALMFDGGKFANAIYYPTYDAYVTSWAWLAVLVASSTILLAAGIASAIFDAYTVGPDVLGFASSMTRNNKYMDLPREDGTLSGAERARALADVHVMMQDVKPGAGVGKIALETFSEGTKRLARGRMYR
ncbi:hypothetical protein MMC17_007426 [Xylographa soralifera]|nr:hypothetical protein [Xylographa soralifera]